jgi:biopolymer transport protein ExbD
MAIKQRKQLTPDAEMNMTPMIDCVFLLLIFFMVTTVFKNPAKLTVTLPAAENYKKLDKKQLNLEVDAEGRLALNSQDVTLDSFDAVLMSEKKTTGTNSMVIKADVATKHGLILKIMQLAKSVGIETIAVAIENKKDEK